MKDGRPQRIYKYQTLAGEHGRSAVEDAVNRNRLYCQTPKAFNDPFDCAPNFYFGDNPKQRADYAKTHLIPPNVEFRADRRRRLANLLKMSPEQVTHVLAAKWPEWMAETSVSCFTEENDNLLMWAHYGNKHTGVCFVFDEAIEEDFYAVPVVYKEDRRRVNLCSMTRESIMEITLLTKSVHWKYENELRIIGYRTMPGFRYFPPKCLKGLIMGANIQANDREFVRDLSQRRPDLELWQAEVDPDQFKVNIVPHG